MPTTITHSYPSKKHATNAAATLRRTFRDDLVKVDAKNAVTVETNNDKAITAVQILIEEDAAARSKPSLRDNPAPFSRLLGLGLLSDAEPRVTLFHEPAPLSRMLGLGLLSDAQPRVTLFHEPAPLSRMLGLPTIIRD